MKFPASMPDALTREGIEELLAQVVNVEWMASHLIQDRAFCAYSVANRIGETGEEANNLRCDTLESYCRRIGQYMEELQEAAVLLLYVAQEGLDSVRTIQAAATAKKAKAKATAKPRAKAKPRTKKK